MRQPPIHTIADDAIKTWKITAILYMLILWLSTAAGLVLSIIFDFPLWYVAISILLCGILHYVFVNLLPKVRWKRWRYEIFEQEIYIQHGILIISRTLVPMIRVQHVDTKQGPILKKYQLASVTISTAATTHEIPALLEEDASSLRDRISALARVDEDDV
ncbi:hypothetical protein CFK37_03220 [Virgibacillus phasianinus]|uniref:YdbS-like PH domain-containing protein n=1 Tax=Virgibacillus phasianinus TaxID=2017483 RepID=A0A220TZJ6_9BACI|nr:PH domain-containing protein [Virgibacillus phasianinus]ASK61258.1 hypothetical protein CFK37_03220 [Virgibacillus phasianinus]